MARQVQLRRGTTAQTSSFTGAVGEVTVDTDKDVAVVHDGSTAGGHPLTKASTLGTAATTAATDYATAAQGATADAALPKAGGAVTGAITTNSTFDGVDIATRDAVLTATTTTANAALPKAGGAVTGAITTNSTFDGVDIATRDAVLTSTTTTANAALPKAGGTMSGDIDGNGNKVLFANVYSAIGDLPSATTYHGLFAHVHATGKGYYAHAGSWIELANQTDLTSTTTTANAALPKAGGTLTGALLGTSATFSGDVVLNALTSIKVPVGTTAQRPSGANGMLRYNSTDAQFEGYADGAWGAIAGGGGDTQTITTTSVTQTALGSYAKATSLGIEITVIATDTVATERTITKLLVTHDGTTAVATQYGEVNTATAMASYDVDISGSNIRLLATAASTNSTNFTAVATILA